MPSTSARSVASLAELAPMIGNTVRAPAVSVTRQQPGPSIVTLPTAVWTAVIRLAIADGWVPA